MHWMKSITVLFVLLVGQATISARQHIIRPAVGDQAPEIVMANPSGKMLQLSSLSGKVVLIDFWASWCRTCRTENTIIRQAYHKYKAHSFDSGRGFDVFSVSLDDDREIWMKAIFDDKLVWPNQVCDFKKWDSPIVQTYNFRFLPQNVLIDSSGKILAKGLYGKKLGEYLAAHMAE
jgi:thiol-disulfide isomerase/thioredoxin